MNFAIATARTRAIDSNQGKTKGLASPEQSKYKMSLSRRARVKSAIPGNAPYFHRAEDGSRRVA